MNVEIERSVHVLGGLGPGSSVLDVDTIHVEDAMRERLEAGWKCVASGFVIIPDGEQGQYQELVLWWSREVP